MQVITSSPFMLSPALNLTLLGTAVRDVDNGSYTAGIITSSADITIPTGTQSCLAIVIVEVGGGTAGERFPLDAVRFGNSGAHMTEWFTYEPAAASNMKIGVYYDESGLGSGTVGGTTNHFFINANGATETIRYFRVILFFFADSTFTRVQNANNTTGSVTATDQANDADISKAFASSTTEGNMCIAVGETYCAFVLANEDVTQCVIATTNGYENLVADGDDFPFVDLAWQSEHCCSWAIADGTTMEAFLDSTVFHATQNPTAGGHILIMELGA